MDKTATLQTLADRVQRHRRGGDAMTPATVYAHLCCEGWVTFGPYAWVGFSEDGQSLLSDLGVIASRQAGAWRVADGKHDGMKFRTPLITPTRRHPFPNRGCLNET